MYEEARYRPADIPALILEKNLYGADIDSAAADAAKARLIARAHAKQSHFFRRGVTPNIRAFGEGEHPDVGLFGTLIRGMDETKYHVILANPPYMGSKHFTQAMRDFSRANYPDSCRDLCAMFIERGHEMTVPGGLIAMVTMESWMFLSSFESLRKKMLKERTILTMAHLGSGVFGSGAVISTTAFIQASHFVDAWPGTYFRLVDSKQKQRDLHEAILGHRLGLWTGSGGHYPMLGTDGVMPRVQIADQLTLFGGEA